MGNAVANRLTALVPEMPLLLAISLLNHEVSPSTEPSNWLPVSCAGNCVVELSTRGPVIKSNRAAILLPSAWFLTKPPNSAGRAMVTALPAAVGDSCNLSVTYWVSVCPTLFCSNSVKLGSMNVLLSRR